MRKCKNDPDRFCYICGKVALSDRQKCYRAYFGIKLGDQDKSFAPHICCKTCVENLRRWSKGKIKKLPFGVPMVWREKGQRSRDRLLFVHDKHVQDLF